MLNAKYLGGARADFCFGLGFLLESGLGALQTLRAFEHPELLAAGQAFILLANM